MLKAIVCINGTVLFHGEIESYNRFTQGQIKVITKKEHIMYLTHSSNVVIYEEW